MNKESIQAIKRDLDDILNLIGDVFCYIISDEEIEQIKEHLEHIRIRMDQQDELNTQLCTIHNKLIDITNYIKEHEEKEQVQGLKNETIVIPSTSSSDELPEIKLISSSSETEELEESESKIHPEKLPFAFMRENNAAYLRYYRAYKEIKCICFCIIYYIVNKSKLINLIS